MLPRPTSTSDFEIVHGSRGNGGRRATRKDDGFAQGRAESPHLKAWATRSRANRSVGGYRVAQLDDRLGNSRWALGKFRCAARGAHLVAFIGSLSAPSRSLYLSFLSYIPTMSVHDCQSPLRLCVYRLSLAEGSSCALRRAQVFRFASTLYERAAAVIGSQPRIRFLAFRHRRLLASTWHIFNLSLPSQVQIAVPNEKGEGEGGSGDMPRTKHYGGTDNAVHRYRDEAKPQYSYKLPVSTGE